MPVQDKTVVVRGSQAVVSSVTMYPQSDGSVVVVVSGATKDAGGGGVDLAQAQIRTNGVAVIDNLMARALSELRKANGLET